MSQEVSEDGRAVDESPEARSSGDADRPLFDPAVTGFPWLAAGIAGALTFLAEYVVVAVLVVLSPVPAADAAFDRLTVYAFNLFGAHGVPVVRTATGFELDGPARLNVVLGTGDVSAWAIAFLLVPILGLLIAGAAFERWRSDAGEGPFEGSAIVGAGLAGGYVIVGIVAAFVFRYDLSVTAGRLTESVDPAFAFAATLGYPLVVGSVGALVVRRRTAQA